MTKLKAFADDKLNTTKMTISHFDRVESTVRKGENAGYQHFLIVFSKALLLRVVKSLDCVGKSQPITRRHFRLVQTQTNCRQNSKVHLK